MKTKPDDNAFPQSFTRGVEMGLTKREYMATQILAGIAARNNPDARITDMASTAVLLADDLIHKLNT